MTSSMEAVQMKNVLLQELEKGTEHYSGIILTAHCEDTGLFIQSAWFPLLRYNLFLYDESGIPDVKSIDFTEIQPDETTDFRYDIYAKEDIDNGNIVIFKDGNILSYNKSEKPFRLILGAEFGREEDKKEKQLYFLLLSYNSKNPKTVAFSMFDKRKAIVNLEYLIDELITSEVKKGWKI